MSRAGLLLRTLLALALGLGTAGAVGATADTNVGASASDPSRPGRVLVRTVRYDQGSTVLGTEAALGGRIGVPIVGRLRGTVHVPMTAPGRRPIVVLLAGRHPSCVVVGFAVDSPCEASAATTFAENHLGLGYLAQHLATRGYVVASPDLDSVTGSDVSDYDSAGALHRAQLVSRTLDLLARWGQAAGPADGAQSDVGTTLVGKVDTTRVGLIGHGHGGEAAAYWLDYDRTRVDGARYGARGVMALAPTDRTTQVVRGAPYAVVLPLCDGQITDHQGAAVFERSKHLDATHHRYQWAVEGANHNWFNARWTDDDAQLFDVACASDAPTNVRLAPAAQQRFLTAYATAFVERHVGSDTRYDALLARATAIPAACAAKAKVSCRELVRATYVPPARQRRNLLTPRQLDLTVNDEGARTSTTGRFAMLRGCSAADGRENSYDPALRCPEDPSQDLGNASANRTRGPQVSMIWGEPSTWRLPLARATSVTSMRWLVLRAGVNFSDPRNPKSNGRRPSSAVQDLTVTIEDRHGRSASTTAARWGGGLYAPLGDLQRTLVLSDLRIPLDAFGDVDLDGVTAVRIGAGKVTRQGSIQLSDVSFQR